MEQFYADNIIMQENESQPRIGKVNCLKHEEENIGKIKNLNCVLLSQAIDNVNNIVFSEWKIVLTTLNNKMIALQQVSVQKWKGDKVFHEKFYYKDFYPAQS